MTETAAPHGARGGVGAATADGGVMSLGATTTPGATTPGATTVHGVSGASSVLIHPQRVDDAALQEAVWARVQLARNLKRPHTLELLSLIATDVVELHGDRLYGEDPAIVAGFCRIGEHRVAFVGHQKGADVEENIHRNFGMPHPEGYRKAIRVFRLAERLGMPVVTFVDTPGASPDPPAEERGQAEAIARSIQTMCGLRTPIVTVITGEGGSGGALAIAVGDVVLALENAIYSVISPEGCASILWRTPAAAPQAAVAMRLTAGEQQALGVIDQVIPEAGPGAHATPKETARRLRAAVEAQLDALVARDLGELLDARYARYRKMGAFMAAGVPQQVRRERQRLTDRIRNLLSSGRTVLGVGEGGPLRPQAADDADDPPLHEDV